MFRSTKAVQKQPGLFNTNAFSIKINNNVQSTKKLATNNKKKQKDFSAMYKNKMPPSDDFLKLLADKAGIPYNNIKYGEDRFYGDNGIPIYPSNDGAVGDVEKVVLKQGTIISRYGRLQGSFFAPAEDSLEARALPKDNLQVYHRVRLKKDIAVEKGVIAPWFGKIGGGTQYKVPPSVVNRFFEYFEVIESDHR